MTPPPPPLALSPDVAAALDGGKPVVALESTIVTHGMPWPDNAAMARRVEEIIRAKGAVPATIAVIDGTLHAGLDAGQLETLARELAAWATARNAEGASIDWMFDVDRAREKLGRSYPQMNPSESL